MREVGEAIKRLILLLFLLPAGCGLKTDLVLYDDAPKPKIAALSATVNHAALHLKLDITGGSGAVFYQVDRAEIEPDCQCINHWMRYYESSPSMQRVGLQRNINIRRKGVAYAFRVRAKDSLGRTGPWSKVIKVQVSNE